MNTAFDPSQLKAGITVGPSEVNRLEAENIRRAVAVHIFSPPAAFDYGYLLGLHRDMFGDVWKWAGVIRKVNLNIGVDYWKAEEALYNATLDLPYWKPQPLVEQCARLHHRLAWIHPFENGNGRWSRLAADIWSVKHGGPAYGWPADYVGTDSPVRREYVATLQEADRNNLAPLIALHQRYAVTVEGL